MAADEPPLPPSSPSSSVSLHEQTAALATSSSRTSGSPRSRLSSPRRQHLGAQPAPPLVDTASGISPPPAVVAASFSARCHLLPQPLPLPPAGATTSGGCCRPRRPSPLPHAASGGYGCHCRGPQWTATFLPAAPQCLRWTAPPTSSAVTSGSPCRSHRQLRAAPSPSKQSPAEGSAPPRRNGGGEGFLRAFPPPPPAVAGWPPPPWKGAAGSSSSRAASFEDGCRRATSSSLLSFLVGKPPRTDRRPCDVQQPNLRFSSFPSLFSTPTAPRSTTSAALSGHRLRHFASSCGRRRLLFRPLPPSPAATAVASGRRYYLRRVLPPPAAITAASRRFRRLRMPLPRPPRHLRQPLSQPPTTPVSTVTLQAVACRGLSAMTPSKPFIKMKLSICILHKLNSCLSYISYGGGSWMLRPS
ncbi:formin-like protein 5 [Zingiber officinale]|uniref:formin-like protein 5 n=1 Tax=Zingiber officinale TaxID=94328 RepID=UPI001C4B9D62|nr:formin-like protein 5 [Zingiber officinale]